MENKILADTDILIGLQKEDLRIIVNFTNYQDQIVISRVTANEFIYGSKDKREKSINRNFLAELGIVEINEEISALSYNLIDCYGLRFRLGLADALIAATAISKDFFLWTENLKHFENIRELKLLELQ